MSVSASSMSQPGIRLLPNPFLSLIWVLVPVLAVIGLVRFGMDVQGEQSQPPVSAETALQQAPATSGIRLIIQRILENEWCWLMLAIGAVVLVYALVQWLVVVLDHRRWAADRGLGALPAQNGVFLRILLVVSGRQTDYGLAGDEEAGADAIADPLRDILAQAYSVALLPVLYGVWLLPLMGFAGTVYGVAQSISALQPLATQGSAALSDAMGGVLNGLYTAFDTTLLGIVLAMMLALVQQSYKVSAERALANCSPD